MVSTTEDSVIIEKTKELCQTILALPEYQTIRQHVDTFMNDQGAQQQYQRVVEKGNELQHKQQSGMPMTGEEVTEFEKERESLLNNSIAKGFLEAQEAMHQVQTSVSQYVNKTFELGRVPTSEDFDSGSCGEGCGCH